MCHFSPHKQRPKRAVAGAVPRTESTESPPPPHPPRSQLTVPYAPVATSSQNPPNSNGSQHLPRAIALDAQTPVDPTSEELPKLFMDFLMEDRQLAGRRVDTDSITKVWLHTCFSPQFLGPRLYSCRRQVINMVRCFDFSTLTS